MPVAESVNYEDRQKEKFEIGLDQIPLDRARRDALTAEFLRNIEDHNTPPYRVAEILLARASADAGKPEAGATAFQVSGFAADRNASRHKRPKANPRPGPSTQAPSMPMSPPAAYTVDSDGVAEPNVEPAVDEPEPLRPTDEPTERIPRSEAPPPPPPPPTEPYWPFDNDGTTRSVPAPVDRAPSGIGEAVIGLIIGLVAAIVAIWILAGWHTAVNAWDWWIVFPACMIAIALSAPTYGALVGLHRATGRGGWSRWAVGTVLVVSIIIAVIINLLGSLAFGAVRAGGTINGPSASSSAVVTPNPTPTPSACATSVHYAADGVSNGNLGPSVSVRNQDAVLDAMGSQACADPVYAALAVDYASPYSDPSQVDNTRDTYRADHGDWSEDVARMLASLRSGSLQNHAVPKGWYREVVVKHGNTWLLRQERTQRQGEAAVFTVGNQEYWFLYGAGLAPVQKAPFSGLTTVGASDATANSDSSDDASGSSGASSSDSATDSSSTDDSSASASASADSYAYPSGKTPQPTVTASAEASAPAVQG